MPVLLKNLTTGETVQYFGMWASPKARVFHSQTVSISQVDDAFTYLGTGEDKDGIYHRWAVKAPWKFAGWTNHEIRCLQEVLVKLGYIPEAGNVRNWGAHLRINGTFVNDYTSLRKLLDRVAVSAYKAKQGRDPLECPFPTEGMIGGE